MPICFVVECILGDIGLVVLLVLCFGDVVFSDEASIKSIHKYILKLNRKLDILN